MVCIVVSCGALGNVSEAVTLMSEVPELMKTKNNQLEEFCTYRVTQRHNCLYISTHKCIFSSSTIEYIFIYRMNEFQPGFGPAILHFNVKFI